MGPLGELGALFNPGMRHEQEERRAKALRREEEGNSRDVDPRIDLESGVAVITTGDEASDQPATTEGEALPGVGRSSSAGSVTPSNADQDVTDADQAVTSSDRSADPAPDQDGAGQPGGPQTDDNGAATPARPRPRGKRGLATRPR